MLHPSPAARRAPRPRSIALLFLTVLLGSGALALRSSEARGKKSPPPDSPEPAASESSAPVKPDGKHEEKPGRETAPDAPGPAARYLPRFACSSAVCHGGLVEQFDALQHGHYVSEAKLGETAGCGVCHGPASEHVDDSDHRKIYRFTDHTRVNATRVNAACLRCHQGMVKRPHYFATEHARAGMSCASCHEVHYDLGTPYLLRYPGVRGPAGQPLDYRQPDNRQAERRRKAEPPASPGEERVEPSQPKLELAAKTRVPLPEWRSSFTREPSAITREQAVNELCSSCHRRTLTELRQFSHHPVFEGRMSCTDCHDAHHEERGQMLARRTVAETCLQCHQNIRGPHVFEHDPVKAGGLGEQCLECHRPHGSPNRKLHVLFGRGLCLNCHSDIQQERKHRTRPGDCWRNGCHSAIHGSNNSDQLLEE